MEVFFQLNKSLWLLNFNILQRKISGKNLYYVNTQKTAKHRKLKIATPKYIQIEDRDQQELTKKMDVLLKKMTPENWKKKKNLETLR